MVFSIEIFKNKTLHQVRYIIIAKEKLKLKMQVVFGLATQSLFEILLATPLKPDMIYAFDVSFFFSFHVSIICACDVDNWLILKPPFWIINYDNDLTLRTRDLY